MSTTPTPTPTERLVLGTMVFGTLVDEAASFALLDQFVDAGGRWLDTADCYSFWLSDTGYGGQSETVLGRWLAARPGMRDRVLISTKFGAEPVDAAEPSSGTGLSRDAIRAQLEGSLRRLGTDRVDLAWAHVEDRAVPVEETADAMAELVEEGLALRIGASNHPAWLVERARRHAIGQGRTPWTALQHSFSYVHPRPFELPDGQGHRFGMLTDEHLDLAAVEGLETWAYTPLLSGAYDNPAKPLPGAHGHPGTFRRLAALDKVAAELGATRGQVVLAWLAGSTPTIRPILGGSKPDQLQAALDAMRLELPDDLRALLDAA
ncbi:aldo/keto reductase [Antribacter gilvus]|uniref:aldo/keto reductase n=1 Tax=Antribacter gilvus TaxID=2304675 RepID=UPI000F778B8E|nr:aldo/keto reductase [Antribacter gilvus]